MIHRAHAILGVLLASIALGQTPLRGRPRPGGESEGETEQRLRSTRPGFSLSIPNANHRLEGDGRDPRLRCLRVQRKGRYEKLNVDKTVYVSTDGKWFFAGDMVPNTAPRPVRSQADLEWPDTKFTNLFRVVRVVPRSRPRRQRLEGVAVVCDTAVFPVRMLGFVSLTENISFRVRFGTSPRIHARRGGGASTLSANRATGPADASVQLVEYADMECAYCKFRGGQLDKLLEAKRDRQQRAAL